MYGNIHRNTHRNMNGNINPINKIRNLVGKRIKKLTNKNNKQNNKYLQVNNSNSNYNSNNSNSNYNSNSKGYLRKSKKIMHGVNLFKQGDDGNYVYIHYNKKDDSTFNKDPKRCMCINYKFINDFNTYDRCINNALNGSKFCQLHQDCKSYLRQFLSGSEYDNDIELWKDPLIEGSHNCYSYFLNRQVKAVKEKCAEICSKKYKSIQECIDDSGCGDLKPQPGDFYLIKNTGNDNNKERIYKCPEMHEKILNDNPTLKPVKFNQKCPNGYYKGAMVVDSRNSKDGNTYHFYKQIADGTFLHKPGINPISSVDSEFEGEKGRTIFVPHFSNRDYNKKNDDDGIFYNNFCGYYCIPRNELFHKNLA